MKHYVVAEEVLGAQLTARCQAALGGAFRVITFRAGGPLTKSEQALPRALAEECRAALVSQWTQRMSLDVYVPGSRKGGRPSSQEDKAIKWLCGYRGYSPQTVADVLGMAENMVASRCKQLRILSNPQPVRETSEEIVQRGLAALRRRYGPAWGAFQTVKELADAMGEPDVAAVHRRVVEAGNAAKETNQ